MRPSPFSPSFSGRVGGAGARDGHRDVTDGSRTGEGNESGDVEDEADAAVTQDGGAGDALDLPEVRFQALDHHLLLAEETVDEERSAAPLVLDDDHESLRGILGVGVDTEEPTEAKHGKGLPTDHYDLERSLDGMDAARRGLDRFGDADEGQDIDLVPHPQDLAVEQGQGQGQLDEEARAPARPAGMPPAARGPSRACPRPGAPPATPGRDRWRCGRDAGEDRRSSR